MNQDDPGAAVFAHIVRALLGRGIQAPHPPVCLLISYSVRNQHERWKPLRGRAPCTAREG